MLPQPGNTAAKCRWQHENTSNSDTSEALQILRRLDGRIGDIEKCMDGRMGAIEKRMDEGESTVAGEVSNVVQEEESDDSDSGAAKKRRRITRNS